MPIGHQPPVPGNELSRQAVGVFEEVAVGRVRGATAAPPRALPGAQHSAVRWSCERRRLSRHLLLQASVRRRDSGAGARSRGGCRRAGCHGPRPLPAGAIARARLRERAESARGSTRRDVALARRGRRPSRRHGRNRRACPRAGRPRVHASRCAGSIWISTCRTMRSPSVHRRVFVDVHATHYVSNASCVAPTVAEVRWDPARRTTARPRAPAPRSVRRHRAARAAAGAARRPVFGRGATSCTSGGSRGPCPPVSSGLLSRVAGHHVFESAIRNIAARGSATDSGARPESCYCDSRAR
jgi:hypothetical protein